MTTINPHTTRASGTILTAAIYNSDHTNHVTNAQALNAGKIEGATPPVVDGHAAVFDGTAGNAIRSFGSAPVSANAVIDVAHGGTGVTTAGAGASLFAQNGAGFGLTASLASAATTDLGTVPSHKVFITGTTTITSFGSSASINTPIYLVLFNSTLQLTHSANISVPGATNLIVNNSDYIWVEYIGAGQWRIFDVIRTSIVAPTVQTFNAGAAATYTPGLGIKYIKVRMVGGGGGGGAVVTNNGTVGTQTSFGGWTAQPGGGGTSGSAAAPGGAGGTGGANGTGTLIARFDGQAGGFGENGSGRGGGGGQSVFGGAAAYRSSATAAGVAAAANTGSGGGGGMAANTGGGGGAGEYVEFFMSAVQVGASQTYTVGGGGAGATAGTQAGGNGAAGKIIIEEYRY